MTLQNALCVFGFHKGQWGDAYKKDVIVYNNSYLSDYVAAMMDKEQISAFKGTNNKRTEYRQDRTCENCKLVSRRKV